jgi:hypothetical protein
MDFDPLKDYYKILHVPMDADLETMKKSYRELAMKLHPDRGGSHREMVEVILAFEILANPEKRRHYDEARRELFNQNAQSVIQADISKARQKAEEYPREWSAFDAWMHKDFTNAQYGEAWSYFQTINNSTSGAVFWIVGAILGGFIAIGIMASNGMDAHSGGVRLVLLGSSLGVAASLWIHKQIGNSMRKPDVPTASPNPQTNTAAAHIMFAQCRQCGQQLRVTWFGEPLKVRCPNCRFEFYFDPTSRP